MSAFKPAGRYPIDDRVSLAFVALDYAVIFGAAAAAVRLQSPVVTAAAMVIIAGRQVALSNLKHAASHYALFTRKAHNDHCDWLLSFPILQSVSLYRAAHLDHHREFTLRLPNRYEYLHDVLRLPALSRWRRTWVVFLRPLLGHAGFDFLRETGQELMAAPGIALRLAVHWAALLAAFAALGWLHHLLLFWLVPLVWLQPVLTLWAEVSDHFGAADETRNQRGIFYALLFKGHDMYHWVHHQYPYVPFYRVKALQRELARSGVAAEETSGLRGFLRIVYSSANPIIL
jgi:fatty acid desaturase